MDGFTLVRKIRGDTYFSNLLVIIHSSPSLSGPTNEQRGRTAGGWFRREIRGQGTGCEDQSGAAKAHDQQDLSG
jgi:hypothetical protein